MNALKRAWALPVLAVVLVALWQWSTVTANYGANWSALFCTGALQRHPPLVASEHIYLFPNSTGYDGQFYHYIAHDPFLRTDLKSYVDDPRLRYRRILVPLAAYAIALGRSDWIDVAYEIVFLLSVGLGVYWSCCFVRQRGLHAGWGMLFILMPATLISMDRMVVDVALAALTAGALCYVGGNTWKLIAVLIAAGITRETGLLLVFGIAAHFLWRRELRRSGIVLLSLAPALAWFGYVHSQTTGQPYGATMIPLSAIVQAFGRPWPYPAGTPFLPAVLMADSLALAGVLLAFGMALYRLVRGPVDAGRITAAGFTLMGIVLQRTDHWQNVYDFGRVYTPLLLCLAAGAAQERRPWLLLPLVMMLPRLAIQLTPQVLGVIRSIT